MRDAEEGTAARPGKKMALLSAQDASDYLAGTVSDLDQDLKVKPATIVVMPAQNQRGEDTQEVSPKAFLCISIAQRVFFKTLYRAYLGPQEQFFGDRLQFDSVPRKVQYSLAQKEA